MTEPRRRRLAAVAFAAIVALAASACGGSDSQVSAREPGESSHGYARKAAAPRGVPVRPIEISVKPKRAGGSLEVSIEVIGRGHGEGEAFEDTDGWEIVARDPRGQELRRIMNGPAHLERAPVGVEDGSQWDVTVQHTVFFALPANVSNVAVRVAVPAARPVEVQSELR
jgi:hypothetical protein